MGSLAHEGVAKFPHHSFDSSAVYVGIRSTQIAERFCRPAMNSLEYEPIVRRRRYFCSSNCKTEFKGHIESRSCGRGPVDFHSREVVDGIAAATEQIQNLVQPILPARNLNSRARVQTEVYKS